MTHYTTIDSNVREIESFEGAPIVIPKYRCEKCDNPIDKAYVSITGKCGLCVEGRNEIGKDLDRLYAVSIYIPQSEGHGLTNEIQDAKDFDNLQKMAKVLNHGIENRDSLSDFDLIVPPPRGEGDKENHMAKIAEKVSELSGIPQRDLLRKKEEYGSQTDIGNPEKRKNNLKDKIECKEDIQADRILLIDDVATTCATLVESAKAIRESNEVLVRGLVIGRTTSFETLKQANVIEEAENED